MYNLASKRGIAFITFYDLREAQKAVAGLNGQEIHGKALETAFADAPSDNTTHDPTQICSTITARSENEHTVLTESDIRTAFSKYGDIRAIEPGARPHEWVIKYFDLRASRKAVEANETIEISGERIMAEFNCIDDDDLKAVPKKEEERERRALERKNRAERYDPRRRRDRYDPYYPPPSQYGYPPPYHASHGYPPSGAVHYGYPNSGYPSSQSAASHYPSYQQNYPPQQPAPPYSGAQSAHPPNAPPVGQYNYGYLPSSQAPPVQRPGAVPLSVPPSQVPYGNTVPHQAPPGMMYMGHAPQPVSMYSATSGQDQGHDPEGRQKVMALSRLFASEK
jgi:RNA recognition motif-containing protein